jgi:hypothetical protein
LVAIGFDPARDPHGGTCGMCHNPHTNIQPKDAIKSCAGAQCHANWRDVAFHSGAVHRRVAQNCTLCHAPHAARVDASDCTGCHNAIRQRAPAEAPGLKPKVPPPPFDTTKALQSSVAPPLLERLGQGDAPPDALLPAAFLHPTPADSFSHKRHKKLACTTCHDVASRTNRLTFQAPRGCQICHHQAPSKSNCAVCHTDTELREVTPQETVTIQVKASGAPTRSRSVAFAHAAHSRVRCQQCHTTAVTLAPADSAKQCRDCHTDHHAGGVACADCHRSETTWKGHVRESHVRCSACHAESTVARLEPRRSFCLACHEPKVDHYVKRECTECHMLASPDAFRPLLGSAP